MLQNFVRAQYSTITEYELDFDDGHNNGFAFPCDEAGHLLPGLQQAAVNNYHYCMDHPEKFSRFNRIVSRTRRYRDNAHGTCSCGNEVELYDQYLGACQCEKCGKWYNLFGQELLPPDQWEPDPVDY